MISSKTGRRKRLLVSVATAAVVACGVLAPTASALEDNGGSVDKGETRATPEQCKMYKDWYNTDLNAKPPNPKGAEYTKALADRRGCKWAEAATAPSPFGPGWEQVRPHAAPTSVDGTLTQDLTVFSP